MNAFQAATAVAGLMAALTGVLSWRLSQRAQRMAGKRQDAIDQGPFIEQQRLWQTEIVAWYKDRLREMERECEDDMRSVRIQYGHAQERLEAEHRRQLARAEKLAMFWKERAMGRPVSDATIPPDVTPPPHGDVVP